MRQVSTSERRTVGKVAKKPVRKVEHNDVHYNDFLQQIRDEFDAHCMEKGAHLFTTRSGDLFSIFLKNLPAQVRQHYTCNACKSFVNKFGGLVTISDKGVTSPVMWTTDLTPPMYRKAVQEIRDKVAAAEIDGVFVSEERNFGTPVTGIWNHMAVKQPKSMIFSNRLLTPFQYMAEKAEDYKTLWNGLDEYSKHTVEEALHLLETDNLYRSEKFVGPAQWLLDLHNKIEKSKNKKVKRNLIWLAVASAPAGFCHVKSTMIGTLLEDISQGNSIREVKRKFDQKMHPLRYQRPQAAPTEGNIAQAEKILRKLEAEDAMLRRFARLEEIDTVWTPPTMRAKPKASAEAGVFSHLQPKGARPIPAPAHMRGFGLTPQTMTWVKFQKTVLPKAEKIEYWVPTSGNFAAMVTAVNPDAPPIILWDTEKARNPFSWYLWNGGSPASQWGLRAHQYCNVVGISYAPALWSGKYDQFGKCMMLVLEGARDTVNNSSALFPEVLKSEFHSIRSTMEAYSRSRKLEELDPYEQKASGMWLQGSNSRWDVRLRVTSRGTISEYVLDRWD